MINEKTFLRSHTAFWHELLPMAEDFVRERNKELGRFVSPLLSYVPAGSRGLVNELGFRLFATAPERADPLMSVEDETLSRCIADSIRHVQGLRQYSRVEVTPLGEEGIREAKSLAGRLRQFFERAVGPSLTVFPDFPGCGWLDDCIGDVLGGQSLFEVKAGARAFRGSDLRQVLSYCALNFASKRYQISEVCLVNPRQGVFLHEGLEEICNEVAGRPPLEVLSDIVEYVSEPLDRYRTG